MAQVADYNIANASGASVRSDLNSVFSAIKTLNSGGSDPTNTEAFMPYVDTADNNNLKIRNSSNNGFTTIGPVDTVNLGLLPIAGGTMTGVLGLPNQTASNPSIHFGDSTTGFFRKGSNQVGLAASGVEQLFLDQDGITLNLQNEIRFGDSDSSNHVGIKAPSTVSSNKTITLPDETGTFLTSASSIANSNLANSSVTVGSTAISLGATATTVAGLTTLTSTNLQASNIKDTSGNNSTTTEQISKGRAKAWVNFDGTFGTSPFTEANGGIRDAFNVSSVTDNGQGDYTVTMTTAMSTTTYVVQATSGDTATGAIRGAGVCNSLTTTTFRVNSHFVGGLVNGLYTRDDPIICCAVFGD